VDVGKDSEVPQKPAFHEPRMHEEETGLCLIGTRVREGFGARK
jgi:hypothetical protein